MKYLIFIVEIIAILLVIFLSHFNVLEKVIGIVIIIVLSQICHSLFKAR